MKTLKKLSNRKLDEMEERIEFQIGLIINRPIRARLEKLLWRVMNERLRRIGL